MADTIQKLGQSLESTKGSSWRTGGKKLINRLSHSSPKAPEAESKPPPQSFVATVPQHRASEDEARSYPIAAQFTASHTKSDFTTKPSPNIQVSETRPRYPPPTQVIVPDRVESAQHRNTTAADTTDDNTPAQSPPQLSTLRLSHGEDELHLQEFEHEFAGNSWCKTAEVESNEVAIESHAPDVDQHGPVSELHGHDARPDSQPIEMPSQREISEAPDSEPRSEYEVRNPSPAQELSASPRPPQSIAIAYGAHAARNGATSPKFKPYTPNVSNSPSVIAAQAAFRNATASSQQPIQPRPNATSPQRVPVGSQGQPQRQTGHQPERQPEHQPPQPREHDSQQHQFEYQQDRSHHQTQQDEQHHHDSRQHQLQHQQDQSQYELQQYQLQQHQFQQHQLRQQTHHSHQNQYQHLPNHQPEHNDQATAQIRTNAPAPRAETSMLDVGDEAESSEDAEESPVVNNRNSIYFTLEPRAEDSQFQAYAPESPKKGLLHSLRKKKGSGKKSTQIRKNPPSEARVSQSDVARFIKDYKIPKGQYEDSLSALLNWAERTAKTVEEKDKSLERKRQKIAEMTTQLEALGQAKAERDSLQDHVNYITVDLNQVRGDLARVRVQRNEANSQISNLMQAAQERDEQHKGELQAFEQAVALEQSKLVNTHKEEVQKMELQLETLLKTHEKEVGDLKAQHQTLVENLKQQHQTAAEKQNTVIQTFRRRVANYTVTANHEVISDDDFRDTLQGLARRINNLIQWVPRPESLHADQTLDPSQFLSRNAQQGGRNWPKFIRNLCWRTILRGFFSHELGFGVFGAEGRGYEFLDQFRQSFAVPDPQDPSGTATILPNTKEINGWRAALFNVFVKAVRNSDSNDAHVAPFRDNVNAVTDELVGLLQRAAGNGVDPRIRDEVHEVVEGLGVLALEAGAQRAQICLEGCDYGEVVTVGDRFRDEDMMAQGSLTVDLMTQPCLRRVGDGRDDLTMQRVIVKGDFVPLKTGY